MVKAGSKKVNIFPKRTRESITCDQSWIDANAITQLRTVDDAGSSKGTRNEPDVDDANDDLRAYPT